MRKLLLSAMLALSVSGCACFGGDPADKELLLDIRKHMAESLRPGLVDALDNARGPDGEPLYIDAYRDEKANLADRVILSIDRVYPPEAPYAPEPLPWATTAPVDSMGGQ